VRFPAAQSRLDRLPTTRSAAEHRRARYYTVTAAGRRRLASEISQFTRVFGAINLVIQPV